MITHKHEVISAENYTADRYKTLPFVHFWVEKDRTPFFNRDW